MGIATAAICRGHRFSNFQFGVKIIARNKTAGKATAATIEANEIYRQMRVTTIHIAKLINEQIVK